MEYGPPMSGTFASGLHAAAESAEPGCSDSQIQVSVGSPPTTYRWVATFARITPAGKVITGCYFRDPLDAKIKCFVFPLADSPAA
jgi:hypothetical protein